MAGPKDYGGFEKEPYGWSKRDKRKCDNCWAVQPQEPTFSHWDKDHSADEPQYVYGSCDRTVAAGAIPARGLNEPREEPVYPRLGFHRLFLLAGQISPSYRRI